MPRNIFLISGCRDGCLRENLKGRGILAEDFYVPINGLNDGTNGRIMICSNVFWQWISRFPFWGP